VKNVVDELLLLEKLALLTEYLADLKAEKQITLKELKENKVLRRYIERTPRKADVIIVLSGGPGRTQMGIDLYRLGYAPYLLFTSGDSSMEAAAVGQGIPA
jgi:precorrin-6B methylase 1